MTLMTSPGVAHAANASGYRRRTRFVCDRRKRRVLQRPANLERVWKYDFMIGVRNVVANPKLSRVQEKGQVTIPTELREFFGIKGGDLVAFEQTDRGILISPRTVVVRDLLDQIGEELRAANVTADEWDEMSQEFRETLLKEKYGIGG